VYAVVVKESDMGLFEENPWLLVPIIVVTVEVWAVIKSVVSGFYDRRRSG